MSYFSGCSTSHRQKNENAQNVLKKENVLFGGVNREKSVGKLKFMQMKILKRLDT